MKHEKFNTLKTEFERLKILHESNKNRVKNAQQTASLSGKQLKEARDKLDKMKMPEIPVVSSHAIIRYCQRVLKINPQEISEVILTPEIIEMIKEGGDGDYRNKDFKVSVKNNVVTTIKYV
jgi:hypothetical protein